MSEERSGGVLKLHSESHVGDLRFCSGSLSSSASEYPGQGPNTKSQNQKYYLKLQCYHTAAADRPEDSTFALYQKYQT